jgi:hypothetical protein
MDTVIVLIVSHAHYMYTDYKYVQKMKTIVIFSVHIHLRLLRLQCIYNVFNQNCKYSNLKTFGLKKLRNVSIF